MTNIKTTMKFSPVDMEQRKKLALKPGDKIRVWQKVKEKDKTRLQAFEGMVIARKHGNEPGATITARAVFDGIGVERVFPIYSPVIDKIEVISRSKVRRAKLYYIRRKAAKEIKKRMKSVKVEQKIKEDKKDNGNEKKEVEEGVGKEIKNTK